MTGASTGIGKEVARILYSKNARVYMTARTEEKGQAAIAAIKDAVPSSSGELILIILELADLSTIKASVQAFLDSETRLDVLFNNAGVMTPEPGSTTAQGYELQLGVNNVATFLLTKLLTPALVATARASGPGSSRVVWVGSWAGEAPLVPAGGGLQLDNLDYHNDRNIMYKYAVSKTGDYFYGAEYARRHRADGVLSVPINPGNLNTELWRTQAPAMHALLRAVFLHPTVYGAYTELFAGFSPEVTMERSGSWGMLCFRSPPLSLIYIYICVCVCDFSGVNCG